MNAIVRRTSFSDLNNMDEWKADFSVIIRKMFFGMDAYLKVILNVFRITNR